MSAPGGRATDDVPRIGKRGAMHGTRSMYTYYRCRCDRCRTANSAYTGRWEKRRREPRPLVPAAESRRRLEELRDIGVLQADVARMLGYKNHYLPFMRNQFITERNAERVRVVHALLMRQHRGGD